MPIEKGANAITAGRDHFVVGTHIDVGALDACENGYPSWSGYGAG